LPEKSTGSGTPAPRRMIPRTVPLLTTAQVTTVLGVNGWTLLPTLRS
jgi:hypothetical protein